MSMWGDFIQENLDYIKRRYGTPEAMEHFSEPSWYAKGPWLPKHEPTIDEEPES
jgi:hypothetical protein